MSVVADPSHPGTAVGTVITGLGVIVTVAEGIPVREHPLLSVMLVKATVYEPGVLLAGKIAMVAAAGTDLVIVLVYPPGPDTVNTTVYGATPAVGVKEMLAASYSQAVVLERVPFGRPLTVTVTTFDVDQQAPFVTFLR